VLQLKNLSIVYDKEIILKDVDLHLAKNSSLTILGANGSGKSSLAKAISGLIPFRGDIILDDLNSHKLSVKDRAKLSTYIPAKLESYDLQISVREFILIGRFAHKPKWSNYSTTDYQKVDHIMSDLGISTLANQALKTLSSGQQQLSMIAQALAQESPLLIFDEPTAHLDPKNVVYFVQIFTQLKKRYTLVLITHDIQLAQVLKQPILFIQNKQAKLYRDNFFKPETLLKHYGVSFSHNNTYLGLDFD